MWKQTSDYSTLLLQTRVWKHPEFVLFSSSQSEPCHPGLCLCLSEKGAVEKLDEKWSWRTCTRMNRPPLTNIHKCERLSATSCALYSFLLYRKTRIFLLTSASQFTDCPTSYLFQTAFRPFNEVSYFEAVRSWRFGQLYFALAHGSTLNSAPPPLPHPTVQSHASFHLHSCTDEISSVKERKRRTSRIISNKLFFFFLPSCCQRTLRSLFIQDWNLQHWDFFELELMIEGQN